MPVELSKCRSTQLMEQSSTTDLASSSSHFFRQRRDKYYVLGKPRERRRDIEERFQPLQVWLEQHSYFPYPSYDEKVRLAEKGRLTVAHVTNWFANARRRLKLTYPDTDDVQEKGGRIDWASKIQKATQHTGVPKIGRKRKEMTNSSNTLPETNPEPNINTGMCVQRQSTERRSRSCPRKFKSTIIDRYFSENEYPAGEHTPRPVQS